MVECLARNGLIAREDRQPPDTAKLVDPGSAADECPIVDRNVSAEHHIVRQDHVIAQLEMMGDMRRCHHKTSIADACRVSGARFERTMHAGAFSDDDVVADNQRCLGPRIEFQVLWIESDISAWLDSAILSEYRVASNDRMGFDMRSRAYDDAAFNHRVRIDSHFIGQFGRGSTIAVALNEGHQSSFSGSSRMLVSPAAFFAWYFFTQVSKLFPAAVSLPVNSTCAMSP